MPSTLERLTVAPATQRDSAAIFLGANGRFARFGGMTHDADYFRARAIEQRDRAREANRVYLARLHRELAAELDSKAWECESQGDAAFLPTVDKFTGAAGDPT